MDTTRAGVYFEAHIKTMALQCQLEDSVLEASGCDPEDLDTWPCQDVTFDDYDASFELKGTTLGWEPTKAALRAWRKLGFLRCWICYTDDFETYYCLGEEVLGVDK